MAKAMRRVEGSMRCSTLSDPLQAAASARTHPAARLSRHAMFQCAAKAAVLWRKRA